MDDIDFVVEVLKEYAPIHGMRTVRKKRTTGNLKRNSIFRIMGTNEITIGGLNTPAMRYAALTNLKWVALRWKGKQNPNEGWVEDAIKEAERRLGKRLYMRIVYEESDF